MVKSTLLALSVTTACPIVADAAALSSDTNPRDATAQLQQLQQQMQILQRQFAQFSEPSASVGDVSEPIPPAQSQVDGIVVGGAVRTNFSYTSYDHGNKNRGGDFDFDLLRLDFRGSVADLSLKAEIRFFDYMTTVKQAYIGYALTPLWQLQLGITQVPFGNWPYNSNNYFFSSNYYLGLEDDHDLGLLFKRQLSDHWQLALGFFKNDELGGIDGYVSDKTDDYSYDVVGLRSVTDDIFSIPDRPIAETNSWVSRFGYHLHQGALQSELGFSALVGQLHTGRFHAGDYRAYALHLTSRFQRWQLQLQHSQYHYRLDDVQRVAVAAYGFYDSIAAKATSATVNLAYDVPVKWGQSQICSFIITTVWCMTNPIKAAIPCSMSLVFRLLPGLYSLMSITRKARISLLSAAVWLATAANKNNV